MNDTISNDRGNLGITICATEGYCYALNALIRSVAENVYLADLTAGHLILSSDGSKPVLRAADLARECLPVGWQVHVLNLPFQNNPKDYQTGAQLTIAQMRTAAFAKARFLGCQQVWSLDSDVIPPANALRAMQDILAFDGGFYSVATCPYLSQGGGGLLFGRGTATNHILPNEFEEEKVIPEDLAARLKAHRENQPKGQPSEEWLQTNASLQAELKQCPTKGNVFALNASGWRKRGWGEAAYPAIGKGSIVPSDWCGFGCTLMNKQALALADFTGYEGKGTEDLFCVWRKWYPAGIRIAAIPHVLCSHVIRKRDKTGFVLLEAFHETEGEFVGHIRTRFLPWYNFDPGEAPSVENNGQH